MVDTEESTWFSTIGSGVFKLSSVKSKTILFDGAGLRSRNEVFSVGGQNNELIVGLGFSRYANISKDLSISVKTTGVDATKSVNNLSSNRLLSIFSLSGGRSLFGFDAFLAVDSKAKLLFLPFIAIKSISRFDENRVLLASAEGVFRLNTSDLSEVDTLFKGRVTAAEVLGSDVYFGRIDGLWKSTSQNPVVVRMDKIWNGFTRRITAIKSDGNAIWVGTSDAGIVRFDGVRVTAFFSEKNGLLSNNCKSLYLQDSILWVGTNKGLSKIDTRKKQYSIINYTIADGLPSNDINAIFVTDSLVYVGTPAGLTFFDERKLTSKSISKLVLEAVTVDSTARMKNGVYQLPHNRNDISFSFVAISFRSAGDIRYHFRVLGLNEEWQSTAINELRFPAMPPGDYVFELYAVNKFGVQSETIQVPFVVDYPFWRQWWFVLLVSLIILSISWWMINRYAAKKSAEAAKELQTQKRLTELEQQALAAQINPHFIFNCLNTIQHFFLSNEKQRANQYLSMFATLVRETLDFSSRQTIRLSEEVEYLRRYIEMEKMRFKEQFNYRFEIDRGIEPDFLEIPSLLLQPYVENAIRHGIRHKTNGGGLLVIRFNLQNDILHCTVTDNGVGRIRAMALKGAQHIEYQSKGMDLGSKRIELLNATDHARTAGITITDLYAEDGTAAGTSVDITIPVKPNK